MSKKQSKDQTDTTTTEEAPEPPKEETPQEEQGAEQEKAPEAKEEEAPKGPECPHCGKTGTMRSYAGPFKDKFGRIDCTTDLGGCGQFVRHLSWPDQRDPSQWQRLYRAQCNWYCQGCEAPVVLRRGPDLQEYALDARVWSFLSPTGEGDAMEVHYGRKLHALSCEAMAYKTVPATAKAKCSSCKAPVLWVKTKNGRTPVDPTPTIFFVDAEPEEDGKDPDSATVLSGYVSHFATCPQADKHRKPRKTVRRQPKPKTENPRFFDKEAILAEPVADLLCELGVLAPHKKRKGYFDPMGSNSGRVKLYPKDNRVYDNKEQKSMDALAAVEFYMDKPWPENGQYIARTTGRFWKEEDAKK